MKSFLISRINLFGAGESDFSGYLFIAKKKSAETPFCLFQSP
jgi:hypothetical protein